MGDAQVKFTLGERDIPTHWVNLMADLPGDGPPPLRAGGDGVLQPAGPDDLSPIFPMSLILQEVSAEPDIEIPDAVREAYKLWRPTPLFRARRLERELDTRPTFTTSTKAARLRARTRPIRRWRRPTRTPRPGSRS
jgi:tryptophan synthase beta chain